nr:uncharacterized protein LOC125422609 [Ziziphus jujuba var. spinosa]
MNSFIRCPVEYKLDDDDNGGQKSVAMAMEDRFSTLPQDVIHHIMSLLPTTIDTMALSMVSKTFSSAFLCFPIINFVDLKTNKAFFMDSVVNNFLQSRPLIPFDKLRFVGGLHTYGLSTYHRFNNMIDTIVRFAIDRNVKELVLNFGNTLFEPLHDQGLSLSLPPQLFSSETIRDLTLIGISTQQLKCRDFIISSPSIKNLRIIGCRFIRSVTLGCNDKLKQVKIIHHTKIRVQGPTPSLEYLSCYCTLAARCKLDFTGSAFPKLKCLELNNYVTSPQPWINKQLDFSGFRSLETLKLFGTCGLKEIKFHLEYLNALPLYFVDFTNVDIEAPNLVSLTYKSKYYRTKPPEINISSSSTTLKHLDFQGKKVPQRWVFTKLPEISRPRSLKVGYLCRLKNH